jgi:hypothetical protein
MPQAKHDDGAISRRIATSRFASALRHRGQDVIRTSRVQASRARHVAVWIGGSPQLASGRRASAVVGFRTSSPR